MTRIGEKNSESRLFPLLVAASIVVAVSGCSDDSTLKRKTEVTAIEMIVKVATGSMPDDRDWGFHNIPIEVVVIAEGVHQVRGTGNVHMTSNTEARLAGLGTS